MPGVTSVVSGVLNRSEARDVVRTALVVVLSHEESVANELREFAVVRWTVGELPSMPQTGEAPDRTEPMSVTRTGGGSTA